MKNYKQILEDVRSKNPKLSFREAQITASNIFREQKEMEDKANAFQGPVKFEFDKTPVKDIITGQPVGKSNIDPYDVEKQIRDRGVDINSIMAVAHSISPYFTMQFAGKDGVNTLVYLDGPCRVPATGFFRIFYVKP